MSAPGLAIAMQFIPDLKPKILLIDDDTDFLEDQKGTFEEAGGILHTADSFKIALQFLKKHFIKSFYDYIFVDYEFKNEKSNGDKFIKEHYEKIKDTPLAIIAGSTTNYEKLKNSDLGKNYNLDVLQKEPGLTDKFSQITNHIKKSKDGRYGKFVQEFNKLKEKYEKEITISEKQEESNLQKQIKNLFLENVSKMYNQQEETFILGGKKWSPETIYTEVEKSESEVGSMVLELFVNYIDFSIKNKKRR